MWFSIIFRSLVDVGGSLILVEFNKFFRAVGLGGLVRYTININRKFRLVDSSGFLGSNFRSK